MHLIDKFNKFKCNKNFISVETLHGRLLWSSSRLQIVCYGCCCCCRCSVKVQLQNRIHLLRSTKIRDYHPNLTTSYIETWRHGAFRK